MPDISSLNYHTGYLLRMASNAVSHEFARKVSEEAVTVAEWSLMRMLYDTKPVAPNLLADKMGMTKGAVSKLAERLLAKGLVERSDRQDDKRSHNLSLTARGRAKIPVLAAIADCNNSDFFAALTKDERTQLRSILQKLIDKRQLVRTPID